MDCRPVTSTWDEFLRTGAAVRAAAELERDVPGGGHRRRALRSIATTATILTAAALAVLHLAGTTGVASANGGEDSRLFGLTNQYRTSNGIHSLVFSGTLQNIGEGASYNCNGIRIAGRSDDMIRRNYFAHPILGCGQLVFSMMQAFGVRYRSAGENIGWEAGSSDPAGYIESWLLNSPEHLANIRNPNYTEMGVGSDESAAGTYWTGVGSEQNVWIFSEEFAQVGASPPPPQHKAPPPKPAPRNSPAPSGPGLGPAATTPASPSPPPTATPVVIPATSLPQDLAAPPVGQYEGLLPNTIESVLEAFLTL